MTPAAPASHIDSAFAQTRAEGRTALISYLPAECLTSAFLSQDGVALRRIARHADILQLGPPPSGVARALELVRTSRLSIPVVLSCRWQHTKAYDLSVLASTVANSGVVGLHLSDLHPEGRSAGRWLTAAQHHGLATVFAASSGQATAAAKHSTGWVHVPAPDTRNLSRLRRQTASLANVARVPLCVDADVATSVDVAAVAATCEGVIVRAKPDQLPHRIAEIAAALRDEPGRQRRPRKSPTKPPVDASRALSSRSRPLESA